MWKRLVLKELREVALVAGLGLAVLFYFLGLAVGYRLPEWSSTQISNVPFVENDPFTGKLGVISFCLAAALGLSQSYLESLRGTWLWLLHRPISRASGGCEAAGGRNRILALCRAADRVLWMLGRHTGQACRAF